MFHQCRRSVLVKITPTEAEPNGVHFGSFHFIVVWEGYFTLSESRLSGRVLEFLKMFYPPKGLWKAEPNGVHFDSFYFIVVWEGYLTLSKSRFSGGLFEILKMFYPTKGLCIKEVKLFLLMFLFCFRKRILDFQFSPSNPPLWNLQNVLSP